MSEIVPTAPPSEVALVDCPIDSPHIRRFVWLSLLIGACLITGFLLSVIPIALNVPPARAFSRYVPWFFVPLVFGLLFFLHRRDTKRAEAAIDQSPIPPDPQSLGKICTASSFGMQLKTVARRLAARNCPPMAARCGTPAQMQPVLPLETEFEPMPLDESHPQFVALESSDLDVDETDSLLLKRKLGRNVAFGGGWRWAMFQIIPFGFLVLIALYRWRISFGFVMGALGLTLLFLGLGGRGAWRPMNQWLLIPGGVVVRRIGLFKSRWTVQVFRRAECVLIVYSSWAKLWTIAVADKSNHAFIMITTREAQMLLRAWLSPLPTPPLERLSDLT